MNTIFDIVDIAFFSIWLMFALMLLIAGIVSLSENEKRAGRICIILFLLSISGFLIPILDFPYKDIVEIIILGIIGLLAIFLFLPINNFKKFKNYSFTNRLDERDIMFSRSELVKGHENYEAYYNLRPENLESDEAFRKNPGLLSKKSKYYEAELFASANASFKTVEIFANQLNTKVSKSKHETDPQAISNYIKSWAKQLGAIDCGITELKDYHLYKNLGRKQNYGKQVNLKHKYAIAFTVEMDNDMIASSPQGTTVMESAKQYLNAGSIAMQINFFLKELGYDALAHIDGNYQLICPIVAKDAGLGEIGRMGLLMTPKLGPRVRIGVITTDIELVPDTPTFDPSVIDFCNICKKCADTCPANAISKKDMENIDGSLRWQINQEKCFSYWTTCGTDCGRCIAVCPYSHPNNYLHNIVRFGIKNSMIFRRFALKMDDILYGRKPKPKALPSWANIN